MAHLNHGLSIDIEGAGSEFFLTLKAVGKLTHDDYKIITPLLDSALSQVEHPIINVLIDSIDLQGVGFKTIWDDLKLGVKHNKELKKVAIYGNKKWQSNVAKIGNRVVSGEMAYFENATAAIEWLEE
ncbi:STAS/SEC14 domain-containing protein [Pseudoalteromonas fuliginea]|uniref:STAS/SEC14 domain-containing protein n=1 Tax=Pseudoalteromonas fuliginea TaxID=1872678 RepID=A0AB73BJ30_9GAMM|nr:STAS/SEC14 domain-containing protein [Pseudoalteromonas fuliginea]KAA1162500.1 STAS/SEC14 domain-containing protein [Pseudoalteromonas fuliginea]